MRFLLAGLPFPLARVAPGVRFLQIVDVELGVIFERLQALVAEEFLDVVEVRPEMDPEIRASG